MKHQLVIILVNIILMIGCGSWKGSLRSTINLTINEPQPYTVQAWGYPSDKNRLTQPIYYSIGIRLSSAKPFYFTFPDGFTEKSTSISESTLSAHLAPISIDEHGYKISRLVKIEDKGNYSIVFLIDKTGHATNLSLYACRRTLPKIISTLDKKQFFDFPFHQREIEVLFGHDINIGHDYVIIGYECD